MTIRPPTQNSRTAKRQQQLETIFQKNKDAIIDDLNDLSQGMAELAEKWKVSDRLIRRWAERLGICTVERLKKRNAMRGSRGIVNKRPPNDVKPEAAKVWELWR